MKSTTRTPGAQAAASDTLLKHLGRAFLIALAVYITFYSCDRRLRVRNGPWQVTFTNTPASDAAIVINQPKLNIIQVSLAFPGQRITNQPQTILFDTPKKPIPFGEIVFEDQMYLPGTETFSLFGHEIELLPRTLVINKKEYPWISGKTFLLTQTNRNPNNYP